MGPRDESRLSDQVVFQQLIIGSSSGSYYLFMPMHSSRVQ